MKKLVLILALIASVAVISCDKKGGDGEEATKATNDSLKTKVEMTSQQQDSVQAATEQQATKDSVAKSDDNPEPLPGSNVN